MRIDTTRQTHHRQRLAAPAAVALSALVLAGQVPSAEWTPPSREQVRAILNERIDRGGAVGLVAAFVHDGEFRVAAAGRRAVTGQEPVDERTVFEIGSVSKVFTTTLLAEMAARGEVALDDPIARFLPDTVRVPSRNGRQITLLDLAIAASGLPRLPGNLAPKDPANPYADYHAADLYEFLSGYTLPRDPGASYEYSNVGMGLLGHVLARRAGSSYEALVTERILEPLGMDDTHIALTPSMRARLAAGHGADLSPASGWDLDVLAGAGAWRSTAADMLRFVRAALEPPSGALGQAFTMATAPRAPAGRPGLRIGLGWHVLERDGRQIVWHNGQTGGYHAIVAFDRASGANAVVLANSATNIDDIGLHLVDPSSPLRHPDPPRPEVDVVPTVLERYVGRYELTPAFAIEVTREGNALFVQATGQPRFRAFAASPTRFFLRAVEAEITFTVDASGAVTGLVLHQNGRETPGRRVPSRHE